MTPPVSNPVLPSLLHFIQVIVRRKKLIAFATAGTALITVAYTLTLPNIYRAKTRMLPPQQQASAVSAAMMQGVLATIGGDIGGEKLNAKLYSELLKVESLRDRIIDRFRLMELYKKKYRQDVYRELDSRVSIQTGKEGIISLSVEDTDPKRAADIANAFVEELQHMTVKLNITGAGNSRVFLEERLEKAKKDMEISDNAVKSFQLKYKAISAPQQAEASVKTLSDLTAKLNSQEIELSVMRRTMADSSYEVKNLQQAIAALKAQIVKFERGSGSGIVPSFGSLPEREQEYLRLMRSFKTNEATYELLTKQYELAKINEANDISSLQVIQKAAVPERKVKPERARIVLTYTFTAFILSVAVAFILHFLETMPAESKSRWRALAGKG